jgi:hypothetical protein
LKAKRALQERPFRFPISFRASHGTATHWTEAMYTSNFSQSASPPANSQAAIVARLIGAGIRAEAVAQAIRLLQFGQVDLIQAVIDGRMTVSRALRIARKRSRP